jgi:hypothetical protein
MILREKILRRLQQGMIESNLGRVTDEILSLVREEIGSALGGDHEQKKVVPVDRTNVTTTDGSSVETVREEQVKQGDAGQHRAYVVLTQEERAKGFVRPVRRSYVHLKCGTVTTMGVVLAETYARDPGFYGATMCVSCGAHFPVGAGGEFVWAGTEEKVGT